MKEQKTLEENYRQEIINKALAKKLPDGIYSIYNYNSYRDISEQIDIYQVFQSASHELIKNWIERCKKMLYSNWDVGDALVENAHKKRKTSRRFEKARNKLIKDNPGFSKETYEHVIHLGASDACH